MVLHQASSSSSSSTILRNLLMVPQNLNPNPKTLRLTQCAANLFPYSKRNNNNKLKCSSSSSSSSMMMEQSYSQSQVTYPKPSEIPWKKELCNSVSLIGVVAASVEIKHFPSGKVLAWTRLSVKKNATQTSWINLTFWDELAHVAFQHIEKGHQIHVSGRLVTDTVESDDGKQQTYYKVVGQHLNFVESLSPVSSHDKEFDYMMAGKSSGFCFFRVIMLNSSGFCFLLILHTVFSAIISGKKVSYAATNTGSVVELWQAFFANPGEWWDNRKNKRNPKGPDFKHKDTGEALWVEGRSNPPWVKSQLEILDSRMGSLAGHNSRMPVNMVTADEMFSF